jgi:NAD(P)H-hydrate epimerase
MSFDADDRARFDATLARATHVVVGPGLSQDTWGAALLARALAAGKPCVLDADALNLLAARPRSLPPGCVLTPHPGEAARLLGGASGDVNRDRHAAALALARRHGAVVVLKGAGTVVAAADERLAVCAAANPAMASGGMGDVLAGICGAFAAQGLDAFDAASAAVVAHAEAARLAAQGLSRGLLASDVAACVARAIGT